MIFCNFDINCCPNEGDYPSIQSTYTPTSTPQTLTNKIHSFAFSTAHSQSIYSINDEIIFGTILNDPDISLYASYYTLTLRKLYEGSFVLRGLYEKRLSFILSTHRTSPSRTLISDHLSVVNPCSVYNPFKQNCNQALD